MPLIASPLTRVAGRPPCVRRSRAACLPTPQCYTQMGWRCSPAMRWRQRPSAREHQTHPERIRATSSPRARRRVRRGCRTPRPYQHARDGADGATNFATAGADIYITSGLQVRRWGGRYAFCNLPPAKSLRGGVVKILDLDLDLKGGPGPGLDLAGTPSRCQPAGTRRRRIEANHVGASGSEHRRQSE